MSGPATGAFPSPGTFNYRVWAIGVLVSNVGTWTGAPIVGWVADTFGPCSALGVGAAAGFAAAAVATNYRAKIPRP